MDAACLCLESLDKTRAPRTTAYKLKHFAEAKWPTLFGYIAAPVMIEAAARLGIPTRGDLIAVKIPRPRRERRRW